MRKLLIGVDTGGTFTDFVIYDGASLRVHKVLSSQDAPEEAIISGLETLDLLTRNSRIVHGTTVATNAVLEDKGVATVFVTNRGFADLLTIARQQRARLYDLQPPLVPPPVPPDDCLEIGGRLGADGALVEPLTDTDLDDLRRRLQARKPDAVAICLLFSFLDGGLEQRIAKIVPPGVFVSVSSDVLPQMGEYERGIATWLNACVGPLIAGYVKRLECALPDAGISLMQSDGRTVSADQAGARALHLLLSGPAGGLAGAQFVGRLEGELQLITLDMGGTSTDVALIDGDIKITTAGRLGRYPVAAPMVDLHTIGAGGGSIAFVDAGGMLRVGPESAGALPGPACYGRGGDNPTVTDANVVLGRLPAQTPLGGGLHLHSECAGQALARLGAAMDTDAIAAATGVIALANEHMAQALRVISVERGHDPAGFVLMSFGGAGGLHVCALAEALEMRRAIVPPHAGVLSALGMLAAVPGREFALAHPGLLERLSNASIERGFEPMIARARRELSAQGEHSEQLQVERYLDVRYQGQTFTLTLPWQGIADSEHEFHSVHKKRFGHRLDMPVELVNLRVVLTGTAPDLRLQDVPERKRGEPVGETRLADLDAIAGIWSRESLACGQTLTGPAVVTDPVGTTYIPPGWTCTMSRYGALTLTHSGD